MINFGEKVLRFFDWSAWKTIQSVKSLVTQYDDDGTIYFIYGYDGPEVLCTRIWKGDLVGNCGVTQEQNDANRAEFEASYKPTANATIEPRAKDGRPQYKLTLANRSTNFKKRSIYFKTADSGSLRNRNPSGTDYADVSYKLYDVSGSLTVDQSLAAKTVIDWEPTFSYEIIAGGVDIDSTLKNGTTDLWWIAAIGVPDYPPAYYGSVDYINETNLEMFANGNYNADGRAISFLANQATSGYPHTNKMRFIIKHPVGESKRFQIYVEHFT